MDEIDGFVTEEIAECLLILGWKDEARPVFARAYAELSADDELGSREPDRLERLRMLGET